LTDLPAFAGTSSPSNNELVVQLTFENLPIPFTSTDLIAVRAAGNSETGTYETAMILAVLTDVQPNALFVLLTTGFTNALLPAGLSAKLSYSLYA